MTTCSNTLMQIMVCTYLKNLPRFGRQGLLELKKIPILKVLLATSPYILYIILFSLYKTIRHVTHLDTISPPHIMILSNIEQRLFFCYPHRILSTLANPVFDMIAAVPYILHFPLPFVFTFYLLISERRREAIFPFYWCLGWVHIVAIVIQISFPTAAPWFVDSAVLDQHGRVIYEYPNEAGFARLDRFLGIHFFHGLYSTSPMKFGAFPSLHVAVPMVICLNHPWLGKKFGALHVIVIALSAIYICHHYLIDVVAGLLLVSVVRLCMLKVWSPFSELKKDSRAANKELTSQRSEEIV